MNIKRERYDKHCQEIVLNATVPRICVDSYQEYIFDSKPTVVDVDDKVVINCKQATGLTPPKPEVFPVYTQVVYSTSSVVFIFPIGGGAPSNFADGAARFPSIGNMAVDRSGTGQVWTIFNSLGGFDEVYRHVKGGASLSITTITRTLFSSSTGCGMEWDSSSNKVILGHGEAGGFTPGVTRMNEDGTSLEYPWININSVPCLDIWVGNQGGAGLQGMTIFGSEVFAYSSFVNRFIRFPYVASGSPPTCTLITTATINGSTMSSLEYSARNDKFYYSTTGNGTASGSIYQLDTDMTNPVLVRDINADGRSAFDLDVDDNNQQLLVAADDGVYTLDISGPFPASAMTQIHFVGAPVHNVSAWP